MSDRSSVSSNTSLLVAESLFLTLGLIVGNVFMIVLACIALGVNIAVWVILRAMR